MDAQAAEPHGAHRAPCRRRRLVGGGEALLGSGQVTGGLPYPAADRQTPDASVGVVVVLGAGHALVG